MLLITRRGNKITLKFYNSVCSKQSIFSYPDIDTAIKMAKQARELHSLGRGYVRLSNLLTYGREI